MSSGYPTNNVYIGARYVPKLVGEWDSTKETAYEPLIIVTYQGNSYTSRQYVPAGIDISNTEYWVLTGNFNGQIESFRLALEAMNDRVETAQADAATAIANIKKIVPGDYITPTLFYDDQFSTIQGGSVVNDEIVWFGTESETNYLSILTPSTGAVRTIKVTENIHGNSVTWNPKTHKVIVTDVNTPTFLEYNEDFSSYAIKTLTDNSNIYSMTYDGEGGYLVISETGFTPGRYNKVKRYDSNYRYTGEFVIAPFIEANKTSWQGIGCVHDGLIYSCVYDPSPFIMVNDIKGNLVRCINLDRYASHFKYISEIQFITFDSSNNAILGFFSHNPDGSFTTNLAFLWGMAARNNYFNPSVPALKNGTAVTVDISLGRVRGLPSLFRNIYDAKNWLEYHNYPVILVISDTNDAINLEQLVCVNFNGLITGGQKELNIDKINCLNSNVSINGKLTGASAFSNGPANTYSLHIYQSKVSLVQVADGKGVIYAKSILNCSTFGNPSKISVLRQSAVVSKNSVDGLKTDLTSGIIKLT